MRKIRYSPKQIERAEILVQAFIFLAVLFAVFTVFFALTSGMTVGFLLTLAGAEICRDVAYAVHRHYFA